MHHDNFFYSVPIISFFSAYLIPDSISQRIDNIEHAESARRGHPGSMSNIPSEECSICDVAIELEVHRRDGLLLQLVVSQILFPTSDVETETKIISYSSEWFWLVWDSCKLIMISICSIILVCRSGS